MAPVSKEKKNLLNIKKWEQIVSRWKMPWTKIIILEKLNTTINEYANCAYCSKKKSRFLKNGETSGLLSNLGIRYLLRKFH